MAALEPFCPPGFGGPAAGAACVALFCGASLVTLALGRAGGKPVSLRSESVSKRAKLELARMDAQAAAIEAAAGKEAT